MNNSMEARSSNVILKMKFSMPNPPNYLKGQDRLDYLEERAWVSNDFVDYAGRKGKYSDKDSSLDERLVVSAERGNYLDYVSRQGTFGDKGVGSSGTGVWGKNGTLEGEELERVKKVFQTTDGNIWHGIISPTKALGDVQLDTKEKAMDFTKACFTRFLKSTHLRYDNVEWFCGWHDDAESGIKHIQFAFCEKEPHINAKGKKSFTQKGTIKKSVLADALVNFEEYFSGHANDVHIARDDFFKKFKILTPTDVKKNMALELCDLARDLPKVKGRVGYRAEEYAPFRDRIDKIADKLIKDVPLLNESYIDLSSAVAEREKRFNNTAQQFRAMQPSDKISALKMDIRERLGNSIIAFAKRVNFENKTQEFESVKKNRTMMSAQRAEKYLRQKQKSEKRAQNKRFQRLFNSFYSSINTRDYLDEYYRDLERIKEEMRDNENTKT